MVAADAVLDGRVDTAYALVLAAWPTTLSPARGRGFCMLANVALAILHLRASRGVGRVAVVDWDEHHGNGTDTAFGAIRTCSRSRCTRTGSTRSAVAR